MQPKLVKDKESGSRYPKPMEIISALSSIGLSPQMLKDIMSSSVDQNRKGGGEKEVLTGKKLPTHLSAEPGGYGYRVFFEALFQTIYPHGGTTEHVPGELIPNDPVHDNLTLKAIAKNKAIKSNDWERFEKMMDNTIKDQHVKISDILDHSSGETAKEEQDNIDETELNDLIEDVWEDFRRDYKASKAKLEGAVKDEVNDRLREYLSQNSEYLSGGVERHMKKISQGKMVSVEDRISNLGLLTYERKEFMRKLDVIRNAFKIEQRNLK